MNFDVITTEEEEEQIIYFFYSRQQQKDLEDHANIFGAKVRYGTVLHEGSNRIYTEMTIMDDSQYSDAVLIAKGKPSEMIYTQMSISGRDN